MLSRKDFSYHSNPYQMVHCPCAFLIVTAPICWNTSSRLSSSQCSANFSSLTRQMSMLHRCAVGPVAHEWIPKGPLDVKRALMRSPLRLRPPSQLWYREMRRGSAER